MSIQQPKQSSEFKKMKWEFFKGLQKYPSKRWGHGTALHQGNIFLVGGNCKVGKKEGVYRLNCQTLNWTQPEVNTQLELRESHSCNIIGNKIYTIGGCVNQKLTNDVFQYEISQHKTNIKKLDIKNPISPRESHSTAVLDQKTILLFGGFGQNQIILDDFYLLDLQTNTWTRPNTSSFKLGGRSGVTFTMFGSIVYGFGGQIGNEVYTNEIFTLKLHEQEETPYLIYNQIVAANKQPLPRTNHSCVNYKEKIMIMIGGEGYNSENKYVLFGDVWTFDIRNRLWTEVNIINKNEFKPRSGFSANMYQNTLFIFGGFVSLKNLESTSELATLIFVENRHKNESNNVVSVNSLQNTYTSCHTCKFPYLPQRKLDYLIQRKQLNKVITSSCSTMMHAAAQIQSPLQAIGLVTSSLSKINSFFRNLYFDLVQFKKQQESKFCLRFILQNISLKINEMQEILISYSCDFKNGIGFDLKNGLFRLGSEFIIIYELKQTLLIYLYNRNGIFRYNLSKQNFIQQLKIMQNKQLSYFMEQNNINLTTLLQNSLYIFVSKSVCHGKDTDELGFKNQEFHYKNIKLSSFLKYYFLQTTQLCIFVQNRRVELQSIEKKILQQIVITAKPKSRIFSKYMLVKDNTLQQNKNEHYLYVYYNERRVGKISKYPDICGYFQLSNSQYLNFPCTKCLPGLSKIIQNQLDQFLQLNLKRASPNTLQQFRQQTQKS